MYTKFREMIRDEISRNFAKLREISSETVSRNFAKFREISRNWKKISSNFVFRETGETKFRGHVSHDWAPHPVCINNS
jgi:hypothetical protein